MAGEESIEGSAQGERVEGSSQTKGCGNVIGRPDTFELDEEPQPLLGEGERQLCPGRAREIFGMRNSWGLCARSEFCRYSMMLPWCSASLPFSESGKFFPEAARRPFFR